MWLTSGTEKCLNWISHNLLFSKRLAGCSQRMKCERAAGIESILLDTHYCMSFLASEISEVSWNWVGWQT